MVCGEIISPGEATVDHIRPVSFGGANRLDNFRLVHRGCNNRAYAQLLREMGLKKAHTIRADKIRSRPIRKKKLPLVVDHSKIKTKKIYWRDSKWLFKSKSSQIGGKTSET